MAIAKTKIRKFRMSNRDGWANVLSGFNTSRDRRLYSEVKPAPLSTTEQIFEDLYSGDATAARVADLPANEMVREWIDVNIADDAETAKSVADRLEEIYAQSKVLEGLTWGKVYGGAALFLGVNDGAANLEEPLREGRIRSFDFLRVHTRFDLYPVAWESDPASARYGQPTVYEVRNDHASRAGSKLQGNRIHFSRFVFFDGVLTPPARRAKNEGWADSIYTRLSEKIRDFVSSYDGAAILLQDFAQMIYKIEGLHEALASDNGDLVLERLKTMDLARSLLRAIPMDANIEEAQRLTTPVNGMADLLDRMAQMLSHATGIPVTLLMGESPAGLNATGASDVRFFYDSIRSAQKNHLKPKLERLVRLIMLDRSGPTRGKEAESWRIEFRPLWQMTEEQAADLRKKVAETDAIYLQHAVIDPEEVAISRFAGAEWNAETTIDVKAREGEPVGFDDPGKGDE